jgi:hypothetical protein
MASSAPSGPSNQAQKTSARKVVVIASLTESPTKRGWIRDWRTKFTTE